MSWWRALADAEVLMGASWVWNPGRWGTSDGYVDHKALLGVWPAIARRQAGERLSVARAVRMALGGEEVRRLIHEDERLLRGTHG